MSGVGRLAERVRDGVGWRAAAVRRAVRPFCDQRELLGRRVRWPVPWRGPAGWPHVAAVRTGALGDVLLCTPALRALKRANPAGRVTVFTKFPGLLRGLPFVDHVRDDVGAVPADAVWLDYQHVIPPRRHIARVIGDDLGVRVGDVRPSCAVRADLVSRFKGEFAGLGRPVVVVNRQASGWTPNKEWPAGYWEELVPALLRRYAVAEVGAAPAGAPGRYPGAYLDLRGRTSLDELVAAVAAADGHVGPVSGPVHVAAAFRVPAVVIYGGYEHPACSGYPGNVNLYSAEPCAPCWRRDGCPVGRRCLARITPARVAAAVDRVVGRGAGRWT